MINGSAPKRERERFMRKIKEILYIIPEANLL